jgi:GNAT superfamily N-acetyltransferase
MPNKQSHKVQKRRKQICQLGEGNTKSTYEKKIFKWANRSGDGSVIIEELTLSDLVKSTKECAQDFGYYMSRAFIHWPDDDKNILPRFLDQYLSLLTNRLKDLDIKRIDNCVKASAMQGEHVLSNSKVENVYVSQVGDSATLFGSVGGNDVFYISFRLIGNSVELSRMIVFDGYRNNGIGTILVESARNIAGSMNVRLLLFPCPPLAEIRDKKMTGSQTEFACQRLVGYYTKREFVKCLPEYIPVLRISGMKYTHIGLQGFMSSVPPRLDEPKIDCAVTENNGELESKSSPQTENP